MRPSFPPSDLWDWPVSRAGHWAMGLLGAAIVMLVLSPPLMWFVSELEEDELFWSMWFFLPLLTTMGLAILSGVVAVVAIAVMRERSVYLWFPVLAALFGLLLIA